MSKNRMLPSHAIIHPDQQPNHEPSLWRKIGRHSVAICSMAAVSLSTWMLFSGDLLAADQPKGPPPASVQTAYVIERPAAPTARLVGTIEAQQTVHLAARQAAALVELNVAIGTHVQAGDIIARQDDRQLQAHLVSATAAIAIAAAEINVATQDLEQKKAENAIIQQAAADRAASTLEAQNAASAVAVAEATLLARQAALRAAEARRDELHVVQEDLTIRAPFAGNIVAQQADIGSWLNIGDVLVTIVSDQLEVHTDVPERHWAGLLVAPSQMTVVPTATGQAITSEATRIQKSLNAQARTIRVIAPLPLAASAGLADQLTATVLLPIGEAAPTTIVPRPAVIRNGNQATLYVVASSPGGPSTARIQPVLVQFETADGYAVRALGPPGTTLTSQDQVIIEGNERLRPGSPVHILNQPEQPAADSE